MTLINEWLPNPAGNDASGEWVELFNNGNAPVNLAGWIIKTSGGSTSFDSAQDKSLTTSSAPVNLNGWILKTSGTSKFNLKGTIGANEYLLLKRTDTKLVLRNTDEKLFVYDATGKLVDESEFLGSAPEEKSFSRTGNDPESLTQQFVWSEPTPGAPNLIKTNSQIAINNYPLNTPLNKNLSTTELVGMALGAAVVLTAIIMFVLKRNENLSKFFFARDEEIW